MAIGCRRRSRFKSKYWVNRKPPGAPTRKRRVGVTSRIIQKNNTGPRGSTGSNRIWGQRKTHGRPAGSLVNFLRTGYGTLPNLQVSSCHQGLLRCKCPPFRKGPNSKMWLWRRRDTWLSQECTESGKISYIRLTKSSERYQECWKRYRHRKI